MPKKQTCPGCGAETHPQAPSCDCGGDWWREPSFYRWPVQTQEVQEREGLDSEIPF